jgi:2-methylcitrate dehydratase PrpD
MTELRESHGRKLLAYAHALSLRDIPADVIDRAKTCLLDSMGCGLFGSTQPWSQILAAEMVDEGSSGHSSVIGCQTLLSAPVAALCNGTAIHGFELDDLIAASIIHPAASVIPAALATAESTDAGGGRLMEAIVAGYEVMHRLSLALGTEAAKRGFHTTSLVAPVACAVAAGKLLQLSQDQMFSAAGLACSAAAGVKSFAAGHGGGMVKRLHLGRAAEAGVRMAQLAGRDFLGPPFAIDSRFGLLDVFGGAGARPERLSHELGSAWAMRDVWFKVFPICGWIQSAVSLLVAARGPRPLDPGEVLRVQVGVSQYAAKNNGEPAPIDTMGAQYSIPYCAAVALIADPGNPASFQPAAVKDQRTRDLARRVEVFVDPAIEAVYPAQLGSSIKLTLANGTVHERSVLDCHGTPADPCSRQEHLEKFRGLAAARLSAAATADLEGLVDSVTSLTSVRAMTGPLRVTGANAGKRRQA